MFGVAIFVEFENVSPGQGGSRTRVLVTAIGSRTNGAISQRLGYALGLLLRKLRRFRNLEIVSAVMARPITDDLATLAPADRRLGLISPRPL